MEESRALAVDHHAADIMSYALRPAQIMAQVKFIQEVIRESMKLDVHYGMVPGTDRRMLYKLGADKLCFTFRFAPEYEIERTDLPGGHREYHLICNLIHIPTGQRMAQGVGSCSTLEAKYRYRDAEAEITEKLVPSEYWELKKANRMNEAMTLIGGKGFKVQKGDDGAWHIAKKTGQKTEHLDPGDYYNTALKMAKKRSLADAILTATAAGDIFSIADTEDDEDPEISGKRQSKRQAVEPMSLDTAVRIISDCETVPILTAWRNRSAKAIDASSEKKAINDAFKARLEELK